MVEVKDLDEWLYLGALLQLLLAHSADDLAWVSVNTGNFDNDHYKHRHSWNTTNSALTKCVTELLATSGIFTGLDNDSLATGEASGKDDNNLSVLNAEKEKKNSKILVEVIHMVD